MILQTVTRYVLVFLCSICPQVRVTMEYIISIPTDDVEGAVCHDSSSLSAMSALS